MTNYFTRERIGETTKFVLKFLLPVLLSLSWNALSRRIGDAYGFGSWWEIVSATLERVMDVYLLARMWPRVVAYVRPRRVVATRFVLVTLVCLCLLICLA